MTSRYSGSKLSGLQQKIWIGKRATQKFSFSLSKLRFAPFGFNPEHFADIWQIKWNWVWNSANPLFKCLFDLLSPRNFATMATWRNDFSPLLSYLYFKLHWQYLLKEHLSLRRPLNLTKLRRTLTWIKSLQRVPPTFRLPKPPSQRLGRATNWAPAVVFSLFPALFRRQLTFRTSSCC